MIPIMWALRVPLAMVVGFVVGPMISLSTPSAFAESFNIKTGAWEMTYTSMATGVMLPPEVLESMPPERRAKLEEAMKARSSGKPRTRVHNSCITQKDLDQNRFLKGEGEGETDCEVTVLSKSATKLVMERTCPAHEASYKFSIDVKTPESVVGTVDGSVGSGKMHSDLKGRWLGASCEGIKDH